MFIIKFQQYSKHTSWSNRSYERSTPAAAAKTVNLLLSSKSVRNVKLYKLQELPINTNTNTKN